MDCERSGSNEISEVFCMKDRCFRGKGRRFAAGCMAVLCLFMAAAVSFDGASLISHAAEFHGTNIWSGGSEQLFGKSRNYMYRWSDGYQMTFCISPGKHMGSTVVAGALRTTIEDEEIPYIKSREDYEKLAIICTWFDQNGSTQADNATYAAVQTAVWAIMNDGWESAGSLVQQVDRHVAGTAGRWQDLKAYVESDGNDMTGVPSWMKSSAYGAEKQPVQMNLADGVWTAELDVSEYPQVAALDWKFEGDSAGWSKRVENGKLIFTYSGSQTDGIQLSADLPASFAASAKNTTSLNIYIPQSAADQTQAMISAGPYVPKAYLKLSMSGGSGGGGDLELKIYRHNETFLAHYIVELDKFCSETGQTLEGAGFQVLEAFDGSQIGGNIRSSYMTPKPVTWKDFKVCADALTDENGHISHMDIKRYEYEKTYCDGHPEPEYQEVPAYESDPETGTDNSGEIAAVEEANARLKAQWEALIAACESLPDHFHGMNPGEGLEQMLADRQEAYDRFIRLEYDYTFRETQARYGYVRHGEHNDDEPIPVVRLASSETGGGYEIIDKEVIVNESVGSEGSSLEYGDREDEEDENEIYQNAEKQITERKTIYTIGDVRKTTLVGETAVQHETSAVRGSATPSEASEGLMTVDWTEEDSMATPSEAEEELIDGYQYNYYLLDRAVRAVSWSGEAEEAGDDSVLLPEPIDDDVPWIEPSGDEETISYSFHVEDHRTEGEIHINKRDQELQAGDTLAYDSYGDTQGDAALEGAVYGLYAAEDIIHPDGKTGVIYEAGALTSIAATDKNGDASFLAYTEESPVLGITGHPLIPGRYCVKEIARSEGYELADSLLLNDSGEGGQSAEIIGRADVTTAMTHPIDMHDGSWLEFDVTYQGTAEGFDIVVSGFPEGSTFYHSAMEETKGTVEGGVVVGTRLVETGEYEKAEAGEYRLDENGNYIPMTDEDGRPLYDTSKPASRTYYVTRRLNVYPQGAASPTVDPDKWIDMNEPDLEYIKEETSTMLEQMGYHLLEEEEQNLAPWIVLELKGKTNSEIVEEILDWFALNSFWDSGAVHSLIQEDGGYKAIIFYDQLRQPGTAFYEERSHMLYVKIPVETEGSGQRHMYVSYEPEEFVMEGSYATVARAKRSGQSVVFPEALEESLELIYEPLYERYKGGENRLDGQGNPIPVYRLEYIYEEKEEITSDYKLTPLPAVYDSHSRSYRIHVENTVDWSSTGVSVTETFRAVAPQKSISVDGHDMFFSDYLTNVKGAGASAFAAVRFSERPMDWKEKPEAAKEAGLIELVYPGQISVMQDGEGVPGCGTRDTPFPTKEKIIKQAVKVIKDIHGGETEILRNFRFKVYLKSNLERLFRDENGQIVWIDRSGRNVEILSANAVYPGLAPDIFTRVPKKTEPLYKNTMLAIEADTSLYDEEQNTVAPGYTAVLEKDGSSGQYNYKKFFQAIQTANHDKWDDGSPTYTSYRPLGNESNRSKEAEANARISDMVRQFAIDWYLDKEVEKLTEAEKETAYGDQLYDEALYQAILKANNYLKPFFDYDLDEIYSIKWERDKSGGSDGDRTTLSADQQADGYCYGVSEYLPYGTYVVVEQQPRYAELMDYPNRHYAIDEPKEIVVPSIYEGDENSGETLSGMYIFRKEMSPEELTEQYEIRFNEEEAVLSAHNNDGDFQIYKYGMNLGKIDNGVGQAGPGDYFALTQDRWKPYQNYYNAQDDRTAGEVTYYLAEGMGGREKVGQYYRYSSVSENAGMTDGVETMTGMTTAYDGVYSPALVFRSLEDTGTGTETAGLLRIRFRNELYKTKIRIEKMDSETKENLLHDEAIFNIYKASCEEAADGNGQVKTYEEDTVISGSREFLESMRARDIRPMTRNLFGREMANGSLFSGLQQMLINAVYSLTNAGPGNLYTGTVPAGTPICQEKDQIFQTDAYGMRIGKFASFTTVRDGSMKDEETNSQLTEGEQNVGYLETPQALEAGVYVLAEAKAPAGYVRCGPVAVEVYSDAVTYYREGDPDKRVEAEIFDHEQTGQDISRLYVENVPTRLQVEKVKEASSSAESDKSDTVTYKLSGRIDGSLAQIGGNPNYEYAYQNGQYMGYGWRKGTLEYLQDRKNNGEQVEIVYHGGLFAGYGYVTSILETADDENPYVAGAVMTLFEGIPLKPSGDTQDQAFEGLTVERSANGTVTRMYVREGFAGSSVRFVQVQNEDEVCWSAETVEREDTDILYYDMGNLQIFQTENVDGLKVQYGFGRKHERIPISQIEEDKKLVSRTDGGHSIFAFRDSVPVLEFVGGDFTSIVYSAKDRTLEGDFARPIRRVNGEIVMGEGVTVYHLDEEGNRDSLVDPYTGMAYAVTEEDDGEIQVLVWPVKIARDEEGNILAKDKITTFRTAAVNEDHPGQEYLTGSWCSAEGEESHSLSTWRKNRFGQNMNEEQLLAENNGAFDKSVNPVYDRHGLPVYYQRGDGTYEEDTALYDRSGSLIRRKEADLLEDYDEASYSTDQQSPVYHRLGESYILENTWITGESSPDDPFAGQMTDGQADILKRVPAGSYIMEELSAPEGYLKGLPVGVIVEEDTRVQTAEMTDYTTKIVINKIDGSDELTYSVFDMSQEAVSGNPQKIGTVREGKGTFSYTQMSEAVLALYEAERVYTSDLEKYPDGTYLKKKEDKPAAYLSTNSRASSSEELTAQWTTTKQPLYLEGIPAGDYLLEEERQPEGFVSAPAVEVSVSQTRQIQEYTLYNDHTRIEVEKYTNDNAGQKESLVSGAEMTLYQALQGEDGQVVYDGNGNPVYDGEKVIDCFITGNGAEYAGFVTAFENMYRDYGTAGRVLSWSYDGAVHTAEYVSHAQIDASVAGGNAGSFPTTAQMMFRTDMGTDIQITAYQQQGNRQGRDFTFEYQFDYRKLPEVNDRAVSYMTVDGIRRFEYLPVDGVYVLVETGVPDGFAAAGPVVIVVKDMADVQRYRIFDGEGSILISKTLEEDGTQNGNELAGASMALYRAGDEGQFIQEDKYLAARWISGQDGVYTEMDRINGRIPEGYQEGDLKPHTLKHLPTGDYWLVELKSPDYYTTFQPVLIHYDQEEQTRIVRVSDAPAKGEIEVRKTDAEGLALSGAVFRLTAYRQPDFANPVFVKIFSDFSGTAELTGLPVGEVMADGSILPYSYRLQEIIPPEGYAVNPQIFSFEFEKDRQGISYSWGESARYQVEIKDDRTRVVLQKSIFSDAADAFVEGAHLAVYHVLGRDEEGNYIYDPEEPVAQWITEEANPDYVLEGLVAGQTYLLAELQAPEGYALMKPVAFILSEDGRRISAVSSQLTAIEVHHLSWLTLSGRYAVKAVMEVFDEEDRKIVEWISTGRGRELTGEEGIQDGKVYRFLEKTIYSDGSEEVTGSTIKRVRFQNGSFRINDRMPEKTHLCLEDQEGIQIAAWYPTEEEPEFTAGSRESEEELLKFNRRYRLVETTLYNDGSRREAARFSFMIDKYGFLKGMAAYDQVRRVCISKTDMTGEKEIPGAELQILDEQGEIVEEWISGETSHEVEAKLLPGHRYTLRETISPQGYAYASDISFTVLEDGTVQQVVMEDKLTCVTVTKTDITGEKELPGARLRILDKEGNCVEEWISGSDAHEITGKLTAGETYVLQEESAPSGYARAENVEFRVSLDGTVDKVIMRDERLPDRPGDGPEQPSEPQVPREEKPVGMVLAAYDVRLTASAGIPYGGLKRTPVPVTGDDTNYEIPLGIMALSLILLAVLWLTRKKTGLFCGLVLLLIIPSVETRAETVVPSGENEIVVTYDPIAAEPNEENLPADTYLWEGTEYELKSYQLITAEEEAGQEALTETVLYEEVEQAMEIPQTVDTEDGAVLSISDVAYDNWRWLSGFQFLVTVEGYDAGSFQLGDKLVPVKEEEPFEGCEKELLEIIGVDPEYYQIESAWWTSDPWVGEGGLTYRQAIASGQKYVADVTAVYTGRTLVQSEKTEAYQAVYVIPVSTPSEPERTELHNMQDTGGNQPETLIIEEGPRDTSGGLLKWFRNLSRRTKVVLGLGILFLPLASFLLYRRILKHRKITES